MLLSFGTSVFTNEESMMYVWAIVQMNENALNICDHQRRRDAKLTKFTNSIKQMT